MNAEGALPGRAFGLVTIVVSRFNHTGHRESQLHEITSLYWKIDNLLVLDYPSYLGVTGLKQSGGAGDFDFIGDFAHFHSDVQLTRLVDLQTDPSGSRLKARHFAGDGIIAGAQVGEIVVSLVVSQCGPRGASINVTQRDRGTRNDRPG